MRRTWVEEKVDAVWWLKRKIGIGRQIPEFYSLPSNTTCWHFRKNGVPSFERLHRILVVALHEPKGHLEYDMLEAERVYLRKVSDASLKVLQFLYRRDGRVYRL